MAADPVFIDTNVLVAASVSAHPSHGVASAYLGLIRFRGQFDYAACLSVNILSNSAGLTIPMAE